MAGTLAHRKELCFWGWGYTDEALTPAEQQHVGQLASLLGITDAPPGPPGLDEFDLRAPRVSAPDALSSILSATPYDRITHGYGKSFADLVRMQMRDMPNPPDWVAFPRNEDDIWAV